MPALLVKLQKHLFRILILILPLQLGLHFWPSWSFVYGIRVDYLAPTIYLQDIIIVLMFLTFVTLRTNRKTSKNILLSIVVLLVFIFINIKISIHWQESLYKWIRLVEFLLVGLFVKFTKLDFKKDFLEPMSVSLIVICFVGLIQFVFQRSIGGPLYFLGERSFSINTPGIAKVFLAGQSYLRAYSIFSHPNSFGGFLVVILALLLFYPKPVFSKGFTYFAIFFSVVGISLSFSLTAYMTTLVLFFFFLFRKKIILSYKFILLTLSTILVISLYLPLGYFYLDSFDESISQRLFLAGIAEKIIQSNFVFGIGLNNFIYGLSGFSQTSSVVWLLQPVHNVFLLIFTETGIVGLVFFFIMLLAAFKKNMLAKRFWLVVALLLVCISSIFDHYWFNLIQNQLLLTLLISFSFKT